MAAKNDITGDALVTKTATDAYRDGWDRIFSKRPHVELPPCDPTATQCPRCNNPNGPKLGPCDLFK